MNKVILIGNLTAEPEVRYTPNGIPVAHFTLAVDRNFTNQRGERDADFIRVVAWRKLAEACSDHLTKGRRVAVEGRLQVRSYDDRGGGRRYIAEVIAGEVEFLSPKNRDDNIQQVSTDNEEGVSDEEDVPF